MMVNLVKRLFLSVAIGAAAMLLHGCNGLFSSVYDTPDTAIASEYGFVTAATDNTPGKIYVDATDYSRWVYLNFSDMSIDTLGIDDPEPKEWDIALHCYDAKTNGGAVKEEGSAEYVEDVWTTNTIVTDMSTMMDGYLTYAESYYNKVLSSWLDVDKSTMPPVYTLSGKKYFVALADGREVELRLINFMDDSGVKGYLTIEYQYRK